MAIDSSALAASIDEAGSFNKRKRRHREDGNFDGKPQRRRYDEPAYVQVQRRLIGLGESPLKKTEEEIPQIADFVIERSEDVTVRETFEKLVLQLVTEKPMKIPFLAGVVIAMNSKRPEIVVKMIADTVSHLNTAFSNGYLVQAKLLLRFLAYLQSIIITGSILVVLEKLFARAVDLQTASSEDSLGLEIVKIILMTVPFVMTSDADLQSQSVGELLDKTDIIASTPHSLYALLNPYMIDDAATPTPVSFVSLLQRQLQSEAQRGWQLAHVIRPWNPLQGFNALEDSKRERHGLPEVRLPTPLISETYAAFPDIYHTMFPGMDIPSVPPKTELACYLVRDLIVDIINLTDFNRIAVAKSLIELDTYFPENTFAKRATPYDRLRNIDEGHSTWKPEDVAVDAIFSQLLRLPTPKYKQVYYHSILTELCKLAPSAIAPSLGRAIRSIYMNIETLDLELQYRFQEWFSHHLSNFGFSWKWNEWIQETQVPVMHPKRAFIQATLDLETRLSFPARIRGTLPIEFHDMVGEDYDEEGLTFKFDNNDVAYADLAQRLLQEMKLKSTSIHDLETSISLIKARVDSSDALHGETLMIDVLVTAICHAGSKSLSHVLAQIERCKDQLLSVSSSSVSAQQQIITSVMDYWKVRPSNGTTIVEKLHGYAILESREIVKWALSRVEESFEHLSKIHIFEMVFFTMGKSSRRIRDLVVSRNAVSLLPEQRDLLDKTLQAERLKADSLFEMADGHLTTIADNIHKRASEIMLDHDTSVINFAKRWLESWFRVLRRRRDVESMWILENLVVDIST